VALGMGFDKPDLGFVVHFQRPGSVVHYDEIADYFIRTAFPSLDEVNGVLSALDSAHASLNMNRLKSAVNIRHRKLKAVSKFLELESPSPVAREGTAYVRTPVRWAMPVERIERMRWRDLPVDARLARVMEDPARQHGPLTSMRSCVRHEVSPRPASRRTGEARRRPRPTKSGGATRPVQDFFGKLTGTEPRAILGGEIEGYPETRRDRLPVESVAPGHQGSGGDPESLMSALSALAPGTPSELPLAEAVRRAASWDLNSWRMLRQAPFPSSDVQRY